MLLRADHHRKDKQENLCRSKPSDHVCCYALVDWLCAKME